MKIGSHATIAAFVLIGAGSFMAGRLTSPAPAGRPESELTPAQRASSRSKTTATTLAERVGRTPRTPRGTPISFSTPEERDSLLEEIMRGENPLDRNRALLAFIDQLGPDDFEDAINNFRSLGITDDRRGEYTLLLAAWAKSDPISAITYAGEHTRGRFAINTVLTTWASNDPDSAIRWAESNYEGDDGKNPYYAGIIRALAESDPLRAESMLTGMTRSRERADALEAILPSIIASGTEQARAWIDNLEDPSLKEGAIVRTAEELARIDPEGTAEWLAQNPGEAALRRMDDVYDEWARQDRDAAVASLSKIESPELRSDALDGIVGTIASSDPQAGAALLDQFSADVTNQVVRSYVRSAINNSPALAVAQIARVENEGYRNNIYERAIPRWYEQDPDAAYAWMEANPLPENLLKRINRRITSD